MKPIVLSLLFTVLAVASSSFADAAKSQPNEFSVRTEVPQGRVTEGVFESSQVFPGTHRSYKVYVPNQYQPGKPANLMVFMDGLNYAKPSGAFRVPTVLDNLIHWNEMPVTVAVFVNPGVLKANRPGAKNRSNRSFEYDSLGDRYSRFLIDEFLPVALEGVDVSSDPGDRAVCGISSGGIAAFTIAWERPDQFAKVISHIGSYTGIRDGWAYPGLIRKTKDSPKPIKVYLQEGKDDLDNLHGNWPLANRDMAAALQFAGYTHKLVITDGGHSGQWAGRTLPDALRWLWDSSSESDQVPSPATKPAWQPHPDGVVDDRVPQGKVSVMPPLESTIFADTTRDWAIYVPAQYDPKEPAALMVFQDGERMRDTKGRWRIPTVLDNLIARGDMPTTIAVFLNPGHAKSKPRKNKKSSNRGFEYDSLGDRYSRCLLGEVLPEVEKLYSISRDPNMRAIGGSSSGAICAFTVAWERPDQFRKVYSNVGSFTNLRGGNVYPSLIRKTEPKPLRVYMADTSGNVDNAFGSWPWANQRMASALGYIGYDVRLDWAEGYGHNADYGSSRFPDAMKWLWRDERHQPEVDTSDDLRGDLTLLDLLVPTHADPDEAWQVVADGLGFADAPCCDADGNFYYCDMRATVGALGVYRVAAGDGSTSLVAKESVSGMVFGPDGLIYACQGAKDRVLSIDPKSGEVKVIATGVKPNDLAVTDDGLIFITETRSHQVTRIEIATGKVSVVDVGITRPNGIALSPDQGTLAVSDSGGPTTYTFRVSPEGHLDAKMPTISMRLAIDPDGEFSFNQPPPYVASSRGDGMAVDRVGRYYITSSVGVQVFDPTGRLCGVLPQPNPGQPLTSCTVSNVNATGSGQEFLYITNGDAIYRRALQVDSLR